MSHNVLDPSALTAKLPQLLPTNQKTLRTNQDGVAALSHTVMTVLGFRLIAVDDSAPAETYPDNVLPETWNVHAPGSYAFRYRHEQSSLEFILKLGKLGSRTTINAIALEVRRYSLVSGMYPNFCLVQADKAATLVIATEDFTSPSFYPHDPTATDASPLVHGFISSNRITDFVSQFQLMIVQKLIPGLRKDGYTEQSESATSASQPSQSNPPPARPQPVPPAQGPDQTSPLQMPPRNPLEIGRRDREPFATNPFAPPPLFPDLEGGGMFVGPNHPMFGGRAGQGGMRGPWGGDGFLPPLGAPPGARFDPIGPGLGPFPGGPLPRRGLGRGMPGGGNMQGPDFDDFPPPGGSVSTSHCSYKWH